VDEDDYLLPMAGPSSATRMASPRGEPIGCSVDNLEYHLMSGGSGSAAQLLRRTSLADPHLSAPRSATSACVFQFPSVPHEYINTSPTVSTAPGSLSTVSTKRSPLGSGHTSVNASLDTLPTSHSLAAVSSAILQQHKPPHQQLQQLRQQQPLSPSPYATQLHAANTNGLPHVRTSAAPILMDPPLGRKRRTTASSASLPSQVNGHVSTLGSSDEVSRDTSFVNEVTDYYNVYEPLQQNNRHDPRSPNETTV
jgi:hypothetical protein